MNPEATYGLNQLFELNLKDGSVRKVTEDYIGIILPLDDTSLIGDRHLLTKLEVGDILL